jgi:tetratricopeptide (TPR) repeat protein
MAENPRLIRRQPQRNTEQYQQDIYEVDQRLTQERRVQQPQPQYSEQGETYVEEQEVKTTPHEGDSSFWLNQGETQFRNSNGDPNEIENAIKSFDKAIEIEPLNYLAWSNKGLGLKQLNRFEDALMCYERAIALSPEHVNTWFNKAVLLGCMNRYEEAAKCYNKVLEMEPNHELARRDLNILLQLIKNEQ